MVYVQIAIAWHFISSSIALAHEAAHLSAPQIIPQLSREYHSIDFLNVGFTGSYSPVSTLKAVESKQCRCETGPRVWFSGATAPIDEPLSVHFRGPLKLHRFAYYTSEHFVLDQQASGSWQRGAYFDAASRTRQNAVFLTRAGAHSECLGKALTYAAEDGVSRSDRPATLSKHASLSSDQEFAIFADDPCPESGIGNACGVYRKGIPAYHGFAGATKMFLFEFEMPAETLAPHPKFEFYDLPAIWLLNARIPRTAQYPNNADCSCWASGCGEFDVFEAMNATESYHLYSAFHTFQGIDDVGSGIQPPAFFERRPRGVMRGGVIFDSVGHVRVFMSDAVSFERNISSAKLASMMYRLQLSTPYKLVLPNVTAVRPILEMTSNAIHLLHKAGMTGYVVLTLASLVYLII
ncbi:AEL130Cp [Eremothecium gossypii ATCC 10895]|uniref:glucan endo-1,3-beta-D-glucosidase n=1 Tax=Eremothecium gossypii (strain ATCC 10895 / CBS 109.51 / FGSC 9923 / NRRL Y-1056) TaxID=284811 RepID=Q757Z0_EREGS|nr:AEL130Cp [Eremothecium gossypii ATCC 10895]AAS52555.2 AEL130Cp [Eremothecium gossypii ATCC 10895]AEY96856.1 FAEL130Cp [Eremothecium gossypii FDAG1]